MGKFLRSIVMLYVLVAACLPGEANSATVNLGLLDIGEDGGFGRIYDTPGVAFTDDWVFEIKRPMWVVVNARKPDILGTRNAFLHLSFLNVSTGSIIMENGPPNIWAEGYLYNVSDTYAFRFTGVTSGALGGGYYGRALLYPIPLPATLPLVLTALASLGVVAAKRRERTYHPGDKAHSTVLVLDRDVGGA